MNLDEASVATPAPPTCSMPQDQDTVEAPISVLAVPVTTITVGNGPFAAAMHPNGSQVYVTNQNSGNVSVIDTATDTVVATHNLGTQPFGVAVRPDGAFVTVANQNTSSVSVIDTATNMVLGADIPVGPVPVVVATHPDGTRTYVTNLGNDTVSVIDTASNNAVAAIPLPPFGDEPIGVAVRPDGAFAYVASRNSNTVSVIDTTSNAVVAVIPVGLRPWWVAVHPDGSRAYVTNRNSNSVSVIDTASNLVTTILAVGTDPYAVAVTPDGTRAYVTNLGSDSISVIDTAGDTVLITSPLPSAPAGIAITPDSLRAYVTNSSAGPPGTASVLQLRPVITAIIPGQGSSEVSTAAVITGSGFNDTTEVTADGSPIPCTIDSDTQLSVTLLPHAAGPVPVTITNSLAGDATVIFSYAPEGATLTAAPATIRLRVNGTFRIPTLSATLTKTATGLPLSGKTITFTAGPVTAPVNLGTAVTNASGVATRTNVTVSPTLIIATHYTATFAGDANLSPATATAPPTFQPYPLIP